MHSLAVDSYRFDWLKPGPAMVDLTKVVNPNMVGCSRQCSWNRLRLGKNGIRYPFGDSCMGKTLAWLAYDDILLDP